MSLDTPFAKLRLTALAEGVSFLLLLGVAMPLKYAAGYPIAVSIVGSAHGLLFVLLGFLTLGGIMTLSKPWTWGVRIFIASILPFGTFFIDKSLKQDDLEYRQSMASKAIE